MANWTRQRCRGPADFPSTHLLGEAASEEGVKVFSIEPHKALQILSLVDVSLVLLLCQLWQVLGLDGITLETKQGEKRAKLDK